MGKTNRKSGLLSLLLAGAAIPAIATAAAPSQIDDTSINVSYADLNIESEAGASVLYLRLRRASEEVCGIRIHEINGSLVNSKARVCFRETLEAAVDKVDSDALKKIHSG